MMMPGLLNFRVTMDPVATTELLEIVTPLSIILCAPTQT